MADLLSDIWNSVRYLKVIYPLLLLLALGAAWRLPRQRTRRATLAALVGLFLLSWLPVAWLNCRLLESPFRGLPHAPAVDAIVVLSGAATPPQPGYPYGLLMDSSVRRVRYAAWLASRRADTPVLACGPHFSDFPESPSVAELMRDMLRTWGVEPNRVWLEEKGASTAAQSVEAAKILRARDVRRILLVTDASHLRRSVGCFRRQGFQTFPAPAYFRAGSEPPRLVDFLPSPSIVKDNEEAFREWLALAVYKLRGDL